MLVTVKTSSRGLVQGETFDFSQPLTLITGANGSGKSTLFKAIRTVVEGKSTNHYDIQSLERRDLTCTVELSDYEGEISFLSKDDDFTLSKDPYTYVVRGGIELREMSEGQKFNAMLGNKLRQKEGYLFLDEVDSHFDLALQNNITKFLAKHKKGEIKDFKNLKIIYITHSFGVLSGFNEVFDFASRRMVSPMSLLF